MAALSYTGRSAAVKASVEGYEKSAARDNAPPRRLAGSFRQTVVRFQCSPYVTVEGRDSAAALENEVSGVIRGILQPQHNTRQAELRTQPVRVVLEATQPGSGKAKPPVRIFIGTEPRTGAFCSLVATDEQGFILTGAEARAAGKGWSLDRDPLMFETSVPGIFAAGDVRATANRRIAAAVGEGSAAIFSIHQYLRSV